MNKSIEAICLSIAFICVINLILVLGGANLGGYFHQEIRFNSLNERAIFTATNASYLSFIIIIGILQAMSLVVGGGLAGYLIKEGGLFWGFILGNLTFLLMLFLTFMLELIIEWKISVPSNIQDILLRYPYAIILTSAGAFLGQRLVLTRKHHKRK